MTVKIAEITLTMFLSVQPVAARPSKAWCAQQLAICMKAEAKWLPLAQQYDRECSGKPTPACVDLRNREQTAGNAYVSVCTLLKDC